MKYLKFTPYLYLIVAIVMVCNGFFNLNSADANPWLSFGLAGMAFFMFYFRMRFVKKYEEQNKKS